MGGGYCGWEVLWDRGRLNKVQGEMFIKCGPFTVVDLPVTFDLIPPKPLPPQGLFVSSITPKPPKMPF
jgi:hypothetical protein